MRAKIEGELDTVPVEELYRFEERVGNPPAASTTPVETGAGGFGSRSSGDGGSAQGRWEGCRRPER